MLDEKFGNIEMTVDNAEQQRSALVAIQLIEFCSRIHQKLRRVKASLTSGVHQRCQTAMRVPTASPRSIGAVHLSSLSLSLTALRLRGCCSSTSAGTGCGSRCLGLLTE